MSYGPKFGLGQPGLQSSVCVGVFGNFAENPHQTDVPTDVKGNCEGLTTTTSQSKYCMHRNAIPLLFSKYFVHPGLLKGPRLALGITPAGSNKTC